MLGTFCRVSYVSSLPISPSSWYSLPLLSLIYTLDSSLFQQCSIGKMMNLFFWISKTVRKKCFVSINFYFLWYNYSIKILGNDISYHFTTKYVTTTPIRKSRTQNALRIPLNSDIMFFSVTVTFFTKKK